MTEPDGDPADAPTNISAIIAINVTVGQLA